MTPAPGRTERKRAITRWNRRLGLALIVAFPLSYLVSALHDRWTTGALGAWLSAVNVAVQVIATLILLAHAAYSFYVFGFPPPRRNLRTLNGYLAYLVLLIFLLSQTAVGKEPMWTALAWTSYALIASHVVVALVLRRRRPPSDGPTLRQDARALMNPDAEALDTIAAVRAHRPQSPAPPVLEARGLHVRRGRVEVVFGIDLVVQPGEVVALLGANGAGKTTTLRALAGLETAVAGSVRLDGDDVTTLSPAGRSALGMALVVGGAAVFGPMTVQENLEMFGHRLDPGTRHARLEQVAQLFPWLADRAGQTAATLSGGEQQMLAVSQAFIAPPRVLLIDEFTLGLAPKIVAQLMALVREIAAQGTAVLLVEQSAHVATQLASRILVLERGSITLAEESRTVLDQPDLLQSAYLGGTTEAMAAR